MYKGRNLQEKERDLEKMRKRQLSAATIVIVKTSQLNRESYEMNRESKVAGKKLTPKTYMYVKDPSHLNFHGFFRAAAVAVICYCFHLPTN